MKNKIVTGAIANSEGHKDFTGTIEDAVKTIVEAVTSNKMWLYINDNPYNFESGNPTDRDFGAISTLFQESEQPTFTLTGQLVGGAKAKKQKIVGRIIKTPISSVLKGKTRAQLIVSLTQDKGVETVRVVASDYNGSRGRLLKRQSDVIAGIVQVLRPDSSLKTEAKKLATSK